MSKKQSNEKPNVVFFCQASDRWIRISKQRSDPAILGKIRNEKDEMEAMIEDDRFLDIKTKPDKYFDTCKALGNYNQKPASKGWQKKKFE